MTQINAIKLMQQQFCKLSVKNLALVVNNSDNKTGYGLCFHDYNRVIGNTVGQKTRSVRMAQNLLGLRVR
jgi:transposase